MTKEIPITNPTELTFFPKYAQSATQAQREMLARVNSAVAIGKFELEQAMEMLELQNIANIPKETLRLGYTALAAKISDLQNSPYTALKDSLGTSEASDFQAFIFLWKNVPHEVIPQILQEFSGTDMKEVLKIASYKTFALGDFVELTLAAITRAIANQIDPAQQFANTRNSIDNGMGRQAFSAAAHVSQIAESQKRALADVSFSVFRKMVGYGNEANIPEIQNTISDTFTYKIFSQHLRYIGSKTNYPTVFTMLGK